jgi:hypothetical protein
LPNCFKGEVGNSFLMGKKVFLNPIISGILLLKDGQGKCNGPLSWSKSVQLGCRRKWKIKDRWASFFSNTHKLPLCLVARLSLGTFNSSCSDIFCS